MLTPEHSRNTSEAEHSKATDLTISLDEFREQIATETDPHKAAELYEKMTKILATIQTSVESNVINHEELRRVRLQAKADYCLDGKMTRQQIDREIERLASVSSVIARLPDTLMEAAKKGHDDVRLLWLDRQGAFRQGFFGTRCPTGPEHLKSPAYRKLWDHLASENLAPHFRYVLDGTGTILYDTYLHVQLPG
jgi:hypothetical protein